MKKLNYTFLRYSDIPRNGLIYNRLRHKAPLDLSNVTIPWSNTPEALYNFSVYNLLDDIKSIVTGNENKYIFKPERPHVHISEYINAVSNMYFRRRYSQYDCGLILDAFRGELSNLCMDLNIDIPIKYLFDMRIMHREKGCIIMTEEGMLKQLKREFNELVNTIGDILYELQVLLIDKSVINDIEELEL